MCRISAVAEEHRRSDGNKKIPFQSAGNGVPGGSGSGNGKLLQPLCVSVVGFSTAAHGAHMSAWSVANFSQFTALRVHFTGRNSVLAHWNESKQGSG